MWKKKNKTVGVYSYYNNLRLDFPIEYAKEPFLVFLYKSIRAESKKRSHKSKAIIFSHGQRISDFDFRFVDNRLNSADYWLRYQTNHSLLMTCFGYQALASATSGKGTGGFIAFPRDVVLILNPIVEHYYHQFVKEYFKRANIENVFKKRNELLSIVGELRAQAINDLRNCAPSDEGKIILIRQFLSMSIGSIKGEEIIIY